MRPSAASRNVAVENGEVRSLSRSLREFLSRIPSSQQLPAVVTVRCVSLEVIVRHGGKLHPCMRGGRCCENMQERLWYFESMLRTMH